MTHNVKVEMQGKCRRLFYDKATGAALGVASGGGALMELTGDDLIIATYNDPTAPTRIGCIEEYYNPVQTPGKTLKPQSVDLDKVQVCHNAVKAFRDAKKAEADFVLEAGITLFGNEPRSMADFRHTLKIVELHTRGKAKMAQSHSAVISAQVELETLVQVTATASEQLLSARDAAITYVPQEPN